MKYDYEKMWNTLKRQVNEELNKSNNYKDSILYMNIDTLMSSIETKEIHDHHRKTLEENDCFLENMKKEKEERENKLFDNLYL